MNIKQFICFSVFLGVLLLSSGHFIYNLLDFNSQLQSQLDNASIENLKLQTELSDLNKKVKQVSREAKQSQRRLSFIKERDLIKVPEKITVFLYHVDWWVDEPYAMGWIDGCGVPCYHTNNPKFVKESDGVLDLGDLELNTWPEEFLDPNFVNFKGKRPARVGLVMEPDYWRPYQTSEEWKNNQFDVLSSYHLDSDIPVSYVNYREEDARRPPIPFHEKQQDALMLVMVSNCEVKERNAFLGELVSKMSVHSYGKCFNNKKVGEVYPECVRTGKPMEKKCLLPHYKFSWALENSQTEDYVSEKLFWSLEAGTIPLYLGAPNVDEFLPSGKSIIKVSDFETTDKLVEYLKLVASNETLYNEYLDWKKKPFSANYQRSLNWGTHSLPCRICRYLAGLDPNKKD